jgi:hypothetical protein
MSKSDIALKGGYEKGRFVLIEVGQIFKDKFLAFFEKVGDEKPPKFRLHLALHGRSGGNIEGTLDDFDDFIFQLNSEISKSPFFQNHQILSCGDFQQIAIGGDFNFPLTTATKGQESEALGNRSELEKFLTRHFPGHNFDMHYPTHVRSRRRATNILDNAQFFKFGAMDPVADEVMAACFGRKCEVSEKRDPAVKSGIEVYSESGSELSFSFAVEARAGVSYLDHHPVFMPVDGEEVFVYANVIACEGWAGVRKDVSSLTEEQRQGYGVGLQRMFVGKALEMVRNLRTILGGADKLAALDVGSILDKDGNPAANFPLLTKKSWNVKQQYEDGSIVTVKEVVRDFFRQVLLSEEYQALAHHLFAGQDGEKSCNNLPPFQRSEGVQWQKIGLYYQESEGKQEYLENILDRLMHNFDLSSKGQSFTLNNLVNDVVGGLGLQRAGGYEVSPKLAERLKDPNCSIAEVTQQIYEVQDVELSEIIRAAQVDRPVIVGIEVKHNPHYTAFDKTLKTDGVQVQPRLGEVGVHAVASGTLKKQQLSASLPDSPR